MKPTIDESKHFKIGRLKLPCTHITCMQVTHIRGILSNKKLDLESYFRISF